MTGLKHFLAGAVAGIATLSAYKLLKSNDVLVTPVEYKHAMTTQTSAERLLKYGAPQDGATIVYTNHILKYDQSLKVPRWVAERLTSDCIRGQANRRNSEFQPDSIIQGVFSSQNADYRNSGWSRGHMAAAADCKYDQTAMDDTFYLTNIVPQNYANNEGYWNQIEMFCRSLANKFSDVYVLSGPLYLPTETQPTTELSREKHYVHYEVIGENRVGVPTHLYKVILAEKPKSPNDYPNAGDGPFLGAFVVPNTEVPLDDPLQKHQVTLDQLERLSGLKMLPELDRSLTGDLCAMTGCKLRKFNKSRRSKQKTASESPAEASVAG